MQISISNAIGALSRILGIVRKNLQLWLDFEKSEVIGGELVVNGGFDTTTPIGTAGSGWAKVTAGSCEVEYANGGVKLTQASVGNQDCKVYAQTVGGSNNILTVGKQYELTYEVTSNNNSSELRYYTGDGYVDINHSVDVHTISFVQATNQLSIFWNRTANSDITLDNISIKEVTQIAPDISSNSNNAKLFTGKALSFDGVNDYVDFGSDVNSDGTVWTTAIWIGDYTIGSYDWIYGDTSVLNIGLNYGGGVDGNIFYRDLYGTYNEFSCDVFKSNFTNAKRLVFTSDGTDITLYLDGVYIDKVTPTSTNLQLSRLMAGYNTTQYMVAATVSDFQLFDVAWTQADVTFDYNNPNHLVTDNPNSTIALSNLKGYWALSEGSGSIAFDSSGPLGPEEVTNGTFNTDTDWVYDASQWAILNGYAERTNASGNSSINQDFNITQGVSYKVSYDRTYQSGTGQTNVFSFFYSPTTRATLGIYDDTTVESKTVSFVFTAGHTGNLGLRIYGIGTFEGRIDNVSVKEVKADDGTVYDGTSIGATWVDQQPTIPQLGMMDWSKGSNLYLFSEPITSEGPDGNVAYESFDWGYNNFGNCVKFGDNSVARYRYGATVPSGVDVTLSCYIIMDDLSEPSVGLHSASGDFSIVIGGTVGSAISTTSINVGGNVWRISKTANATTTDLPNNGIVKYTTQSNKGFRVVGWQVEDSLVVGNYIGTKGSEAINATLIQDPNNKGFDILGNPLRLREHAFNLDGSGYAEVADDDSLNMSSGFSVDFWVKLNSIDRQFLVTKGTAVNAYASDLGFGTTIHNNSIYVTVNTSVAKYQVNSTSLSASGQWVYVCVSYEGNTTNGLKLYINQDSPIQDTPSGTIDETYNLVIGGNYLYTDFLLSNQIDDVRFYNRPLSSDEVEQNYKAGLNQHTTESSYSDDYSSDYGF